MQAEEIADVFCKDSDVCYPENDDDDDLLLSSRGGIRT